MFVFTPAPDSNISLMKMKPSFLKMLKTLQASSARYCVKINGEILPKRGKSAIELCLMSSVQLSILPILHLVKVLSIMNGQQYDVFESTYSKQAIIGQ